MLSKPTYISWSTIYIWPNVVWGLLNYLYHKFGHNILILSRTLDIYQNFILIHIDPKFYKKVSLLIS